MRTILLTLILICTGFSTVLARDKGQSPFVKHQFQYQYSPKKPSYFRAHRVYRCRFNCFYGNTHKYRRGPHKRPDYIKKYKHHNYWGNR